jgi:hypothetical protein
MFTTPLDPGCKGYKVGPGQWAKTAEILKVPGQIRICLLGFAPATSLDVSIKTPSGSAIRRTLTTDADGSVLWLFTRLPTHEMGTYLVRARQGTLVAETSFEVVPPEGTTSLVVPEEARLGRVVRVWFGALSPGDELPAHLFRRVGIDTYVYVARLGSMQVDDRGFAMIEMQSRQTDPVGTYHLVVGQMHVQFSLKK